jgi:hypothetical protein
MADYEVVCRLFTARCIQDTLMINPDNNKILTTFHHVVQRIGEWIYKHPPSTITKNYISSRIKSLLSNFDLFSNLNLLSDDVLVQIMQALHSILITLQV